MAKAATKKVQSSAPAEPKKRTVMHKKEKIVHTPPAATDAGPATLKEVVFDGVDDTGAAKDIGFDEQCAVIIDAALGLEAVVASYVPVLDGDEAVVSHTFFRSLEEMGKRGLGMVKERIEALGNVVTEYGKITVSVVAASVTKQYTDATISLLESKGLLKSAVDLTATVRESVDVEAIPQNEMDIIEKYFSVSLVPSMRKIDGLVALGKLKALEVDATIDEQTSRKGHTRVAVKPTEEFAEYMGLGQ